MTASYSASVASFLKEPPESLVAALALADARQYRNNEPPQIRAWEVTVSVLGNVLSDWTDAAGWQLILEYPMRRLGRRIDALLITTRAIIVLEFKAEAAGFTNADRHQVEDYALDLQDFHAGSRMHPIVPILVSTRGSPGAASFAFAFPGVVAPVLDASAATLAELLRRLWVSFPLPKSPLDIQNWADAPYRPVPGIVDAACALYGRHGVADIREARATAINLTDTTDTILAAIEQARAKHQYIVVFVTGIPGAGKTLCGLNVVFGTGKAMGAVFLTGNPTLVHVLREALARDKAGRGEKYNLDLLRSARQSTEAAIQALPNFRDTYVGNTTIPPEHVAVIDEAQRLWSADHAVLKSRDRKVRLDDSEPGHLLDIMSRHQDWAVLVCLIGNGQEIHDGEGGLAEWGAALEKRQSWNVQASPIVLVASDPRQTMPKLPCLQTRPALHLDVPMRSVRNSAAAGWVDAVLAGDVKNAREIADGRAPIPFLLTRDLAAMRSFLRTAARGLRRAGLVGSSGAKRLRADGLGVELPHMDSKAVERWFLDRWPQDVRASNALEQVATEFSCQGLELDYVGLCWGGDLIRQRDWQARNFIGTDWQIRRAKEAIANRINTYRVLLTRARYETVIWVPTGDLDDRTRDPAELDAVADYLTACGVGALPQSCSVVSKPEQGILFAL